MYKLILDAAMFSLLPTASRLWALENDGYGRLILLLFGEFDEARRLSSGIGIDDLRRVDESAMVLLRSRVPASLSRSLEDLSRFERDGLCRGLTRTLPSACSRSCPLSCILEGIIVEANYEKVRRFPMMGKNNLWTLWRSRNLLGARGAKTVH